MRNGRRMLVIEYVPYVCMQTASRVSVENIRSENDRLERIAKETYIVTYRSSRATLPGQSRD